MSKTLRSAIVGCGVIAPSHGDAIKHNEGIELAACCDIVEDKAKAFAGKYGCDWYTDYDEMLKREDVDIIHVCTFSGLHAEMGIKAALAGKHVIVEKPIDVSLEAADRLIKTCREQGVKLSVISQNRWLPSMVALKRAIEDGELGELNFIGSHTKWWRTQEYYDGDEWRGTWALDGGGALMNQSVHYVDLMQHMMGEVDEVSAFTALRMHNNIEVEDIAVANVRFKSGALGMLEGNTALYPGFVTRLDVFGTDGGVMIENSEIKSWKTKTRTLEGGDAAKADIAASPEAVLLAGHHVSQIADVIDAINNDRDPAVTGEAARHPLAIILAVYESASKGGIPVKVR